MVNYQKICTFSTLHAESGKHCWKLLLTAHIVGSSSLHSAHQIMTIMKGSPNCWDWIYIVHDQDTVAVLLLQWHFVVRELLDNYLPWQVSQCSGSDCWHMHAKKVQVWRRSTPIMSTLSEGDCCSRQEQVQTSYDIQLVCISISKWTLFVSTDYASLITLDNDQPQSHILYALDLSLRSSSLVPTISKTYS